MRFLQFYMEVQFLFSDKTSQSALSRAESGDRSPQVLEEKEWTNPGGPNSYFLVKDPRAQAAGLAEFEARYSCVRPPASAIAKSKTS